MAAISESIKSELKTAIGDVVSKSNEKTNSDFASDIAKTQVQGARAKINNAESKVKSLEPRAAELQEQIANPPKKEVSSGGKNNETKMVVDEEALAKIKKEHTLVQTQITQAKTEVTTAKEDADRATDDALTKAGVSGAIQAEMDNLMTKVTSLQDKATKGEAISDNEIKEITDGYNAFKGKAPENKGGVISAAFYDPLKKGLDAILKAADKQKTEGATNTTNGTTSSTANTNTASATSGATGSTTANSTSSTTTAATINTTTNTST
ncbi:MAG: hypothetical protein LW817_00900 [Candidatus Caenarcaniphilales bacterium]|jgi:chromosome segregation ATPase|nr:hypothetical protein [Candidatus Caenarcaniphilales bacterium]